MPPVLTPTPPARPTVRGVALAALAWTTYGLAYAGAVATFSGVPFRFVAFSQLLHAAILGGAGALAWWVVVRWLVEARTLVVLAAHAVGAVLYTVGTLALLWLSARAGGPEAARGVSANLGWIGVSTVIVYLAQVAVYHAAEASRRARARRDQGEALRRLTREQELRTLRAQLNPHFLFNALNTISAEVGRDADAAREAIGRLADLMRYALDAGHRDLVPLADEVAFVRDYLALEGARMGDRLDARISVDAAARGALVPPMALQTLVENAVRHGLAPSRAGGRVSVTARRCDDAVRVEVADTGVGAGEGGAPGIGLANTDERLRLLFGPGAALCTDAERPVGFAVSFAVPAEGLLPDGGALPDAGAARVGRAERIEGAV